MRPRRLLPADFEIAWWLPYSWLVYLSFFILYAVFGGRTLLWWTLHALAVAVFLPLYFRGFWLEGRRLLPIMAAITALGTVYIPWNPGASVFFVYASGYAGDTGPPRVAVRWLVAVVLVAGIEALVCRLSPDAWIPAVVLPLIIGGGNIAFAEKRRADARLRLARDEVAHLAKVAERERIARDLHDLLGHTLSVIVLKSELAAKLSDRDPARAAAEIRDVERISRLALTEVRRAVEGYRQLTLEESLVGIRQALTAGGVALESDVTAVRLDPKVEGVASLVLREAITNVIRHANATTCRVQMREERGRLSLVVCDDGVGGAARAGTGLTSMRSRVEEVGGHFEHDGGAGTTVRVDLPLSVVSGRP
ncbi:MAG TPA: sensor histidine kinase [Vicinamibacterales bacterium]|jgi:two-component system sensor histidine kinase DesK